MKNLKKIIQEKLKIDKNTKLKKPNIYHFVNNDVDLSDKFPFDLSIKLPFELYFPQLNKRTTITYIKEEENELGGQEWAFYEWDKEVEERWRVLTLNINGLQRLFIRKSPNFETLITYIKAIYYGKILKVKLENPENVIVESLDEKLKIDKNTRLKREEEKIYWFTNNRGIKLPFEVTIKEIHDTIKIVDIDKFKYKPNKYSWKFYDENKNHVFTLNELALRVLLFGNLHKAIVKIYNDQLAQKVKNPEFVEIKYNDNEDKILKESINI